MARSVHPEAHTMNKGAGEADLMDNRVESKHNGVGAWLSERIGIRAISYPVPKYANSLLYSLGGITAVGFVILVITGILLTQWYDPFPDAANKSIQYIMTRVYLGRFIRGMHYWTAQIVIISVALHLLRVLLTASYKRPREMNWIIGLLLLGAMVGLFYTGTVLKWDQEGYEALEHTTAAANLLGPTIGKIFSPEFAKTIPLNVRLYAAHISLLPLTLALLLGIHMLLIKVHKISPWALGQAKAAELVEVPFAEHIKHLLKYSAVVYGLVAIVAAFAAAPLGFEPVEGVEMTKPPIFFWWLFAIENWFKIPGLLVAPTILGIGLLAVPFLDRSKELDPRRRPIMMGVAVLALALLVFLTVYAGVSTPKPHIGM